ncbi:hypothetical protein HYU94_03870 [Candidatus Daviesbacteria bacterium]|nr:hypothetical protein [Candidatus Daviesbacteria bacterium]
MSDKKAGNNLNNFDFFQLLGLGELNLEKKKEINNEINSLIWDKFILSELDKLLDQQSLEIVEKMIDERKNAEDILKFILRKLPQLEDVLSRISVEVKKTIMEGQFNKMIENLEITLPAVKEEKDRIEITGKIEKYLKAKNMLEQEDWEGLEEM